MAFFQGNRSPYSENTMSLPWAIEMRAHMQLLEKLV